ncbi:hypothetical protein PISMIDRAFT_6627 [Pisolithus microcarpus 441]|uniref:Uncharacterized protein n=1 Tax=Pisolithus microcarpus 441 TaxID=765257 RepID=A0A0D0ACQ3_9AGAM|nr:hypothetical protein BKA83DRAFT_6627 [Pisolithus microcarpus]KIK29893.1 hypothetical protein PISMIDRAFT_6627 [Pisolithus microcarpus 441]
MLSAPDPESSINEYVKHIQPAFALLVANTAFSTSLFTLLVVLLALSTRESRRRPVFQLNVLAICTALTMGVVVGFCNGKLVLSEVGRLPVALYITSMALTVFLPLLSDSILLTRLFALYPLSSTNWVTLLKIFTFPFCIKCARIVVLTRFLNRYSTNGHGNPWSRNANLIPEWAMQIADNMYFVSFFLYNLHVRTGLVKRAAGMQTRIRQIFYISVANFVLPLIFGVALIILLVIATSANTEAYLITDLLLLINSYITVMGVLCATVWFSGSEWVRTRNEPLLPGDMIALKQGLGRVHDAGRRHGSDIVVVGKRSATPNTADLDTEPVMDCKQPTVLMEEGNYCTI